MTADAQIRLQRSTRGFVQPGSATYAKIGPDLCAPFGRER
jgi:hypothetical protein